MASVSPKLGKALLSKFGPVSATGGPDKKKKLVKMAFGKMKNGKC